QEHTSHMLDCAYQVLDADILIGSVATRSGVAGTNVGDWHVQSLDEHVVRARAATHWDDQMLLLIHIAGGIDHQLNEWIVGIGASGWLATVEGDLDVLEAVGIQVCAELFEDILWALVWYQAE